MMPISPVVADQPLARPATNFVVPLEPALICPQDVAVRLAALERYGILDTPPEQGFDDVVHLATQLCRTSMAFVSLIAADRLWFKARVGFDACEAPLAGSVCAHVLRETKLLVIPDMTQDPRTKDNASVAAGPCLRFYAGVRLQTPDGVSIGTLCVLDTKPRSKGLTEKQSGALQALARQVEGQLELRYAVAQRDDAVRSLALAERRLVAERDRLAQMFAQAPGFMAMLRGPEHMIEMANEAYMRLVDHRDVLGWSMREAFPDLEGQGFFEILDRIYATGKPHVGRAVRLILQSSPGVTAEERFVDFVYQPVTDEDGTVSGIFVQGSDVTRQVTNERMLRRAKQTAEEATRQATTMAMTDPLTGLANRRSTLHRLDAALAAAQRTGETLSVVMFDVDHFKRVNDTWGHAVGDEVLRCVARHASEALRGADVVGRIGGEEFLLLLPNVDAAVAMRVAERVRLAIQAGGGDLQAGPPVTASFGVATWSGEDAADLLLQRADDALYEAKRSGRNTLRLAA